jgi:glucosamine--fructose-6-phosphate aminotransferase (isomerizing)
VSSFDFAVYPEAFPVSADDAVIVMAHSGVKTYSTRSLERAAQVGAVRISVGSMTAEHAGSQQVLRTVEREKSAAFTASHLAAMTVLAQIAVVLGASFRSSLSELPALVQDVLDRQDSIAPVAARAARQRIYAVGAGPNEATALEAVIKVREAAQGWIDGLALEQFLHGPLIAANAGDLAIVVNVPGAASGRTAEITRVLAAIGLDLWIVGEPVGEVDSAHFALPPGLPEILTPLLAVIPIQLFAYFMSVEKGIDPDKFRRDEARYANALSLLKL